MREERSLDLLRSADEAVRRDGRAVLCQIVRTEGSTPGKLGWRMLVQVDGTWLGNLGGGAFEAMVQHDARSKLQDGGRSEVKRYYLTEEAVKGQPTGMVCGGMVEVFLEVLELPPQLVVVGAGPVGQAVAAAGRLAGFDLLVVDDRSEFLEASRFPEGTHLIEVDREVREDFLQGCVGRDLSVAIVSRCWETDTAALAAVLRQAPPGLRYLGLLGSRRKVERVRQEIEARGQSLEGIPLRAPIGLSGLGDSPGQIAIAILAEVLQLRA